MTSATAFTFLVLPLTFFDPGVAVLVKLLALLTLPAKFGYNIEQIEYWQTLGFCDSF